MGVREIRMRWSRVRLFWIFASTFLIVGCGVLPSIPAYTYKNNQQIKATVDRASFSEAARVDPNPNVFVGVSISGGGSRAATFGTAVLSELDRLGFLDHVKVISSVSGGGLPAAYFALNGDKIRNQDDWNLVMKKMGQSFRTSLIWKQLRPDNLILSATTDLDRSDLLMDIFDNDLFQEMTYGDLGSYGKRRPVFIANATEIGLPENRFFPFSSERLGGIGSRITDMPISTAVVASAAFPGLLNSVTLKAWPPEKPNGMIPNPYYVHLIDGGPIDNLGITTLRAAARTFREKSGGKEFNCLLFVIDAHPADPPKNSRSKRDLRSSPIDYIFDTNVFDGIDALSVRRRYSDLAVAGIVTPDAATFSVDPTYDPEWPKSSRSMKEFRYVGLVGQGGAVNGYDRVAEMKLSHHENLYENPPVPKYSKSLPPPIKNVSTGSCIVWHISLNGIRSLGYDESDISSKPGPHGERDHPALIYRNALWHTLTRVGTDFNLNGPKNCKREFIEQSMFDAATVLVREDRKSLRKVCNWFGEHLGTTSEGCLDKNQPLIQKSLPVVITKDKDGEMVRCDNEDGVAN